MGEAGVTTVLKAAVRIVVLIASSAVVGAAIAYLISFNVALAVFTSPVATHGRRDFLFDPSLVGAYLGAASALVWICTRK